MCQPITNPVARSLAALAVTALASAACVEGAEGEGEGEGEPGQASASLRFAHTVDGAALALGTDTPHTNAAGNQFGVTRLSYFVSDVMVTLADGATLAAPGGHYLDHDTPETLALPLDGEVPAGALVSVAFVMGLPPALNESGAFPSAPASLMEWPESMGGGYHFMKSEGKFIADDGATESYATHSGALGGVDYSFAVTLDASALALDEGASTIDVEMHVDEWYTNPTDWDFNDYFPGGIMMNADAQAILKANGADVFALGAVTHQ